MWNRNVSGGPPSDDDWVWVNSPSQHPHPPPQYPPPPQYSQPQQPRPPYGLNINISGVPCYRSTSTYSASAPPRPQYTSYPPSVNTNVPVSGGSYYSQAPAYDWVPCHNFNIPSNAVKCGNDLDGKELFIGLSHHQGDELPCKVIPRGRAAYVCYDGREIQVHDFKVLVQNSMLRWLPSREGQVPVGAIPAGRTRAGEVLYIGRSRMRGATVVGKVHPSHRCLYVPFDGKEVPHKEYEVLVL